MIYLTCGILLIISTQLFKAGALNATTRAPCWTVAGTAWFVERLTRLASCHPERSDADSEADDASAFRLAVLLSSRLPAQGHYRRQGIGCRRSSSVGSDLTKDDAAL
jgi:hypothetical protein